MTLRARITISITVLLAVMVVALGFVAVRSAQRVLVAQVDAGLIEITERFSGRVPDLGDGRIPLRQTYAVVVLDADGQVIASAAAGFEGEPEPLPDTSAIERPADGRGEFSTVPSVDGDPLYRVLAIAARDATIVLGQPLDGVLFTVARLRLVTFVGGAVILAIGAAITWWTIRRETLSIDEMVDTAKDVGAGDRSRRIQVEPAAEELATLRDALNEMFERSEAAFETELETQDRLRRFVADASHELRTPLTAISGYAQLHRMGGLEEPAARGAAMERIEAESDRMERLVADLLLLARTDEPRAFELRPIDLADLVAGAGADHAAAAETHPVVVGGVAGVVMADRDALTQVLANLLGNVRAHTPDGTTATITTEAEGDEVVISVSDDGPGVDPEHLPHLFDRFYRAQDPRRRSGRGSGLGLAIVAGLVQGMDGSVSAENGPEGGLTIHVRLGAAENGAGTHGDP